MTKRIQSQIKGGYMTFLDQDYFSELERSMPEIFTRETACKLIGGIFSPRTLSNFDAAGNGPRIKLRIGKKVAYKRHDFLEWLEGMVKCQKKEVGKRKINHYGDKMHERIQEISRKTGEQHVSSRISWF